MIVAALALAPFIAAIDVAPTTTTTSTAAATTTTAASSTAWSAPVQDGSPLQWRVDVGACDGGTAKLRLSIFDQVAATTLPKDSMAIDGALLRCPTSAEPSHELGSDGVAIYAKTPDTEDDGEDRGVVDVASMILSGGKNGMRGVVVLRRWGAESVSFEHALYVAVDGKVQRVWHDQHPGFEMGHDEERFAIDGDHLVHAVRVRASPQPMKHVRVSWDAAKKRTVEEAAPYWLIVVGRYPTLDKAEDVANNASCVSRPYFGKDVTKSPKPAKNDYFIVAEASPTRAAADKRFAEVKKCAPDAILADVAAGK